MSSPPSPEWRDNTPFPSLAGRQSRRAPEPSADHAESQRPSEAMNCLVSFSHVKNARERRAKELAQWLEFKCSEYPELARFLQKPIKNILKEARRNKKNDNDRVLSALERGPGTIDVITRRTGLPQPTVYAILRRGPLSALIEVSNEYVIREPGRGGYRRPRKIYSLK